MRCNISTCLSDIYSYGREHFGLSTPALLSLHRPQQDSMSACIRRHAVEGVLKGYDPLLNLVLDETKEFLRGAAHAQAFQ